MTHRTGQRPPLTQAAIDRGVVHAPATPDELPPYRRTTATDDDDPRSGLVPVAIALVVTLLVFACVLGVGIGIGCTLGGGC